MEAVPHQALSGSKAGLVENQVWGAGTEWKNAQTIRAKSLALEGKAASRSRQSDPHLGSPTSGFSRPQLVGCTCHLRARRASQGSRRDQPKGRRKRFLGPGLRPDEALTGYICRCTHWRWSRCRHSSLQRCSS